MLNIKKQSKVLVIIVTYNGMKWLERCLNSVVDSSIPLDAYIVDNGSTDGSQEFITTNYPQFIFYQSPTNSGFGAANNIGLKYAIEHNYDYVYLLNQDAWVMPNTIATLIEINKNYPEYGVLSPLQTNAEMDKLDGGFTINSVSTNSEIVTDYLMGNIKSVYSVDFVMAAHWLISRECILKTGGFSSVFYHYGEDNNYLHRVKYFGYKAGIVPAVMAVHDREHRKLTKEKELYLFAPLFLVTASNPNESFVVSLAKAYSILLKKTLKKVVRYRDIRIFLTVLTIISKVGEICRGRKISQKAEIPFLCINTSKYKT